MKSLLKFFARSSIREEAPPSPNDTNIAVNLDGVHAGTHIINLEIILRHTLNTRHFTTSAATNDEIFRYQMEGIICRLGDVMNDVILKFSVTALKHLDLGCPTGSRIRTRFGLLKDITGKIPNDVILKIQDMLSYNLSKLRVIAKELGLPLHHGPESLILLRNSLVHRNGAYDSDMLRELECIWPNPSTLCENGRLLITEVFIEAAIKKSRDFIRESESILHETYGVEWTVLKMEGWTRIRQISEWAYKDKK
jgi:hypothetical protein